MKIKLIAFSFLVVVVALAGACARAPEPPAPNALNVTAGDFEAKNNFTQETQAAAGETFTVTLASNQTTGFRWSESATISDTAVLQQLEHKYTEPASDRVGAGGVEIWTFKALKAGTGTVSMDYSRPWEGGEKGVWTYKLTVTVK